MSKHNHNYSQYSNKNKNNGGNANVGTTVRAVNAPVEPTKPVEPATPVTPVIELVQETVETVALPATVPAIIAGCAKLNVRAGANLFSDIVCVLDTVSEFEIDVNKSTNDWYYIYTAAGAEGYCMKKYVKAHM